MVETKHCTNHPGVETNLACSRCGEPICTSCMVHAPVGVRCPKCAQVKPLPTFEVKGTHLLRAVGAGVASGVAGGVIFGIFSPILLSFPLLTLAAMAGLGHLTGEAISASVNRKMGRTLKYVAAGSVVVAFVVTLAFGYPSIWLLMGLGFGIYMAVNRF